MTQPSPAPHKQPRSAAAVRERTIRMHRWIRYAIQIAFFILAPGLFSGAFNGVKYIFTQIGVTQSIELNSFVALLIATVAFTVVFGRFFCGYACAFGTLGDIVYAAVGFVCAKAGIKRPQFPKRLVKALSLLKYAVLVGICGACVLGVWPQLSGMSPWVAFAGFTSGSLDGIGTVAFVLLALLVVCMAVRERFFCQFLCPMGAVFSLLPVLGFSEFTRTREHCAKNCGRCKQACPVDLWPDADRLGHGECVSCGRCADVCPLANVNLVALEKNVAGEQQNAPQSPAAREQPGQAGASVREAASRPLLKKKDAWRLLRGTEPQVVVGKAVLLLFVCWVLAATRSIPAFADVFGHFPGLF